jgi:hypothetical protein
MTLAAILAVYTLRMVVAERAQLRGAGLAATGPTGTKFPAQSAPGLALWANAEFNRPSPTAP